MPKRTRDESRALSQKWRAKNRAHAAAWMREYRAKKAQQDPEYWKKKWLRLKAKQGLIAGRPKPEACDICGTTKDRIVFDHDHQLRHFRGWICHRCNVVLGLVEDDARLLIKLIAYLQRNRDTSAQFTLPGI